MLVFSNRRLGLATEFFVSPEVGAALLRAVAAVAEARAVSRWERELAAWLELRAARLPGVLDVMDFAWSPEHFERQRAFVLTAIGAAVESTQDRALVRWAQLIEAHPRDSVQVGRRWSIRATT